MFKAKSEILSNFLLAENKEIKAKITAKTKQIKPIIIPALFNKNCWLILSFIKKSSSSIKITLPKEKSTSVIYNTLSSAAVGYPADVGHSLLKVSPSINWSALGQTLFQRACFIGELFGKGKEFEVNGLELPRTGAQKI